MLAFFFSYFILVHMPISLFRYLLLVIVILTIIIYANFLRFPFVYDDIGQILSNDKLHDLSNLYNILFCNMRQTRFVQNISFAFDWWLGSGKPEWFRITNLTLHLINSFLFLRLLRNLLPALSLAFLATGLFLIHPLQIQSVHYIMGRITLLETILILIILNLKTSNYKFKEAALILTMIISIMVKETAVLLPLYIILCDFFIFRIPIKELPWRRYLVYFSLYLLFIPYTYFIDKGLKEHLLVVGFDLFPSFDYLIFQLHDLYVYFELILNPIGQSIIHGIPALNEMTYLKSGLGLFILCLSILFGYFSYFKKPVFTLLILLFYLTIFPYFNFITQYINPFAEYRYYFSTGILLVLFVLAISELLKKEKLVLVISLFFLVYWSIFTFLNIKPFAEWKLALTNAHTLYPRDSRLNGAMAAIIAPSNINSSLTYIENAKATLDRYPFPKMLYNYTYIEYGIIFAQAGNYQKSLEALKKLDYKKLGKSYCTYLNMVFYDLFQLNLKEELKDLIGEHEQLKNENKCPINFKEKPVPMLILFSSNSDNAT